MSAKSFPYYGPMIESRCPQCDYKLTAASKAHGAEGAPVEGDSSVCLNCGQVLIYQGDLTLRKASKKEIRELMADGEAWATIEKIQFVIQRRGRFA